MQLRRVPSELAALLVLQITAGDRSVTLHPFPRKIWSMLQSYVAGYGLCEINGILHPESVVDLCASGTKLKALDQMFVPTRR